MGAWRHYRYWDPGVYAAYRNYITLNAPRMRGQEDDCADLSLSMLIYFAAANGLPITLENENCIRYISKAGHQYPTTHLQVWRSYSWYDVPTYLRAVKSRLNARGVYFFDTVPNPRGPEAGDLMISPDHVALVFKAYPAGVKHPRAKEKDKSIPMFPGEEVAARQLNQTEYFRDDPTVSSTVHFDYLNHRGEGKPKKQAAELIYFADATTMQKMGFEFRMYSPSVLDNWADWTGIGDPPR